MEPTNKDIFPQCDKNVPLLQPALIRKNGYPVETHKVITEDGYILKLHRIPYGKKSSVKEGERRPAVLVQHGILSSSADWVLAIPEKALGMLETSHAIVME